MDHLQIYHVQIYHINPSLPSSCALQDLYVQIQPRKHVPYHGDYLTPTQLREVDHTAHTDQGCVCPEISTANINR